MNSQNNNNNTDIFRGYGIEVKLADDTHFLVVKETLTRMGVASFSKKTLWQSCHILHKRGRYAIIHFKELFGLDGRKTTITDEDLLRRNQIVQLLQSWGLVEVIDPEGRLDHPEPSMSVDLKVLSHADKKHWTLEAKYDIGNSRNRRYHGSEHHVVA